MADVLTSQVKITSSVQDACLGVGADSMAYRWTLNVSDGPLQTGDITEKNGVTGQRNTYNLEISLGS